GGRRHVAAPGLGVGGHPRVRRTLAVPAGAPALTRLVVEDRAPAALERVHAIDPHVQRRPGEREADVPLGGLDPEGGARALGVAEPSNEARGAAALALEPRRGPGEQVDVRAPAAALRLA